MGIYYQDCYVQDKVRPGTGREGGLGHERYFAIEHREEVRPLSGREAGLDHVRREASQRPHMFLAVS